MDAPSQREHRRNWLTLSIFAAVVAVGLWTHEPWRDELQAWTIARVSASPTALVRNLRHEGHPFLWYAFLWPFAKLQSSIWMLQILQWTIAVATAAIVLWRSPFSRMQRSLLLFGYFGLYEYGILARSYGLGMLLAMIALACITPVRRWLPFGVALGMLALTSAFGAALAIALLVGILVHVRANGETPKSSQVRTAIALTVVGCVVAYAQARPPDGTSAYSEWNLRFDTHLGSGAIAAIFKAFLPLQQFTQSWWNTSIADGNTGLAAIAAIGIVIAVSLLWRAHQGALALWLCATSGTVAIMYLKLGNSDAARYFGTIWIAFVAANWLLFSTRESAQPSMASPDNPSESCDGVCSVRVLHRWSLLFSVILIAQLGVGIRAYSSDLRSPFTDAQATAEWLQRNGGSGAIIAACPDFVGSALAGYLERAIIYPQGAREGSFTIWDARRTRPPLSLADALELKKIRTQREAASPRYLVTNEPVPGLPLAVAFTRGIVIDEHYWVYRIKEPIPRVRLDPCRTR